MSCSSTSECSTDGSISTMWGERTGSIYHDEVDDHREFLEIFQQVYNDWNDPTKSLERYLEELRSSVRLVRLVPSL